MARLRRRSTVLETARQRLAGLKSIIPPPDFGSNLKLEDYEREINAFNTKLNAYNETVASLDGLKNELEADEAKLRDKNKRMLSGTEAQYGSDSSQYEQVGGTRQSERKRSSTKSPPQGGNS